MRGRSLTVSYNLAATERASPSPGNSLFSSRIFIYASQNQLRGENASIGSLSKISPHLEQMRKFGSCWGWKRNRQQQQVLAGRRFGGEADFSAALLTNA